MIPIERLTGRMGNKMFQYAYLYAQMREGVIPNIYVQDEKYFEKCADEIKELFGHGIGFLPYIGIHVRRAANPINPDEPKYSENPFYVNLSETDYYERAIELFPGKQFLIFSDDTEWCKEKWGKNDRFQVMEGQTELEDFNMLASCSSIIMANSSFSWWASYLCPNPSKHIVAPKNWYADGNETRTVIPNTWTKI